MERRKFTREFNIEAVKLIQERGVTVAHAARDLGVHGTVWRRWVQTSVADAAQPFQARGRCSLSRRNWPGSAEKSSS